MIDMYVDHICFAKRNNDINYMNIYIFLFLFDYHKKH